ncbi:unnamed protein product [Owenia fusiformis]|uniref:Uncharacterized protein n=1 Tax=Owenia fusiformis TaxID=6347 RepID=A0A8J1U4S9_OWEFU|nr:unnamed protein product [Owenia fusiformis]
MLQQHHGFWLYVVLMICCLVQTDLVIGTNMNSGTIYNGISVSGYSVQYHIKTEYIHNCPEGWFSGSTQCYKLFEEQLRWNDALTTCRNYDAELVHIHGILENEGIGSAFEWSLNDTAIWTGFKGQISINDLEGSDVMWSDGTSASVLEGFWAPGQPDSTLGECVALKQTRLVDGTYPWTYTFCNEKLPFMCERLAEMQGYQRCGNGDLVFTNYTCDIIGDCEDQSDESVCPELCHHYLTGANGTVNVTSSSYKAFANCQWILEGPPGTKVTIHFDESNFDTEYLSDIVNVWIGGSALAKSKMVAELSGSIMGQQMEFISKNNFAMVTFNADASVQGSGFVFTWTSKPYNCGGALTANETSIELSSPSEGGVYVGGLDCEWYITVQPGVDSYISLEMLSLDLDHLSGDTLEILDGNKRDSRVLASYSETLDPVLVQSSGGSVLVRFYTRSHLKAAGFQLKYSNSQDLKLANDVYSGQVHSNGLGANPYPSQYASNITVNTLDLIPGTVYFNYVNLGEGDFIKVFDTSGGSPTLLGELSRVNTSFAATYNNGSFSVQMTTDVIDNANGYAYTFSRDCPDIALGFSSDTIINTSASNIGSYKSYMSNSTITCSVGHVFKQQYYIGTTSVSMECRYKGVWDIHHYPNCMGAYCGAPPKVEHGYVYTSTGVTYNLTATYRCFGVYFLVGSPSITCQANGTWTTAPACEASTCPVISNVSNALKSLLFGDGTEYGSLYKYECQPGFQMEGAPLNLCTQTGWSEALPTCSRLKCSKPEIENGRVTTSMRIYYNDQVTIECDAGYKILTTNMTICNENQTFTDLPVCQDVDECSGNLDNCQHECSNTMGSFTCSCKPGYNLEPDNFTCTDINECAQVNPIAQMGCSQTCNNIPGSYYCSCFNGYVLYDSPGISSINLANSEDGLREGDVYYINHTCVRVQCLTPSLVIPYGVALSTNQMYYYEDTLSYQCDIGYLPQEVTIITCGINAEWDNAPPTCTAATCKSSNFNHTLYAPTSVTPKGDVLYEKGVNMTCSTGLPTPTLHTRECVYNKLNKQYELQGNSLECPVVSCGRPDRIPGSEPYAYPNTLYGSSFTVTCKQLYTLRGNSSLGDNRVHCTQHGSWDYGTLRCKGLTCQDPGTPPDGIQQATTYEEGEVVSYTCERRGYTPYPPEPLQCFTTPDNTSVEWRRITMDRNIASMPLVPTCIDVEAPVVNCTVPLIKTTPYGNISSLFVPPMITDNSGLVASVSITPLGFHGDELIVENIDVVYMATDHAGNSANCSISIIVEEIFMNPTIQCPESYRMFLDVTGPNAVNLTERMASVNSSYGSTRITFEPSFVNATTLPLPIDVTATATDVTGLNASCTFQVVATASPCHPDLLTAPANGVKTCVATGSNGWNCTISCNPGYTFYDINQTTTYTCNGSSWIPKVVPPGCVTSVVTPSYNIEYRLKYQTTSESINDTCANISYNELLNRLNNLTDPKTSFETLCKADDGGYTVDLTFFQVDSLEGQPTSGPYWLLPVPLKNQVHFIYRIVQKYTPLQYSLQPYTECLSAMEDLSIRNYDSRLVDFFSGVNEIQVADCPFITGTHQNMIDVGFECPGNLLIRDENNTRLCLPCPVGYYNGGNGTVCTQCPLGTFQNLTGQSECMSCPDGQWTHGLGSTSSQECIAECSPGKVSDTRLPPCHSCPYNSYSLNSTMCRTCPFNHITRQDATSSILGCFGECPLGSYSKDGYSTNGTCTLCPSHFYQNQTGQTSCIECPNDKAVLAGGSSSLSDCGTTYPDGQELCNPSPCQNNGVCSIVNHIAQCHCMPGFTGAFCAENIDDCASQPCFHGATCMDGIDSFNCTCLPGFNGTLCEDQIDGCVSNQCQNDAMCQDLDLGYNCLCPQGEGLTGVLCNVTNDPCNITSPCSSHGNCSAISPARYICDCFLGYSGATCQIANDFGYIWHTISDTCHVGSSEYVLTGIDNAAKCKQRCDDEETFQCLSIHYKVDELICTLYTADSKAVSLNTTCPGYIYAERSTDECASSPCLNGGTCNDFHNAFNCSCPPGYSGPRCEVRGDPCVGEMCNNAGSCVDLYASNNTICVCNVTGESPLCVPQNYCENITCQNGGICENGTGTHNCTCMPGYSGSFCQHNIDDCVGHLCENGATCVDDIGNYSCTCTPGFENTMCNVNINECQDGGCVANGTKNCTDLIDDFECTCRQGYTGRFCQVDINECDSFPCRHNASCHDLVNDYSCTCQEGWTGKQCDDIIQTCTPGLCDNNATCIDLFNDYLCICPAGVFGRNCSSAPDLCASSNPCIHGVCSVVAGDTKCTCSEAPTCDYSDPGSRKPCGGAGILEADCIDKLGCCYDNSSSVPFPEARCFRKLPGYTGAGCEYEVDMCSLNTTCLNGGTCVMEDNYHKCICDTGFTGFSCETNIYDCPVNACGNGTCIDGTGKYCCKCDDVTMTGQMCNKAIVYDYSMYFYSANKDATAILNCPFTLSPTQITIFVQVRYAKPGDTGTYLTLFGSSSGVDTKDEKELIRLDDTGVYVSFGTSSKSAQFQGVHINDGKWHFVMVSWNTVTGEVSLWWDGIKYGILRNYAIGGSLPQYGWTVLGSKYNLTSSSAIPNMGFNGYLSNVFVLNRIYDYNNDVEAVEKNRNFIQTNGLALHWTGYESIGAVQNINGSAVADTTSQMVENTDRDAPEVIFCPDDIYHFSDERISVINWPEPQFSDGNIYKNYRPDESLSWGEYHVVYLAEDSSNNVAQCNFKVYISNWRCDTPAVPVGGNQSCFNNSQLYGCTTNCLLSSQISCNPVPNLYTCSAAASWNPLMPSMFQYEECTDLLPLKTLSSFGVNYTLMTLQGEAQKMGLMNRIKGVFVDLNQTFPGLCEDPLCSSINVTFNCIENLACFITVELNYVPVELMSANETITPKDLIVREVYTNNKLDFSTSIPSTPEWVPDLTTFRILDESTCPPGQQSNAGQCTECCLGTYFDVTTETCLDCPFDSYQNQTGQFQCVTCPVNTTTEFKGTGSQSLCYEVCPAGSFFNTSSLQCELCQSDFHQNITGQFTCEPCPVGKITVSSGAISAALCFDPCIPGYELQPNGSCIACAVGFYRQDEDQCQECSTGFITPSSAANSSVLCNIADCGPGLYRNVTENRCYSCPLGEYQPMKWQTSCMSCDSGYTTRSSGATLITQCEFTCPDGEEVVANGTCRGCPLGFYKNSTFDVFGMCLLCPDNTTTLDVNSTTVTDCGLRDCSPGYFYNAVTDECQTCAIGSYNENRRQTMCQSCPANYTTTNNASSALSDCQFYCQTGYEVGAVNETCRICPRGTYKNNSLDGIFSTCLTCPMGMTTANNGSSVIDQCNIVACSAGSYHNVTSNTCHPCSKGSYQPDSLQETCILCDSSYTTRTNGSVNVTACIFYCPSGEEVNGSLCQGCPVGKYKDNTIDEFGVCQPCNNSYTTLSVNSTSASDCSIVSCGPGEFRNESGNVCEPCPRSSYQPEALQTSCIPCMMNQTTVGVGSNASSDCLIFCPSGYQVNGSTCQACEIGEYKNNLEDDLGMCQSCPPNFITYGRNSTSLDQCNILSCGKGFYLNVTLNQCFPCEKGSYQPARWQTECILCNASYTTVGLQATNASACTFYCPSGYEVNATNCAGCPRGTYKDNNVDELSMCQTCPSGFITAGTNATSEAQCTIPACEAGQFLNETENSCQLCPVGTYQTDVWQNSCISCSTNYTTNTTGADNNSYCTFYCPSGSEIIPNTESCRKCGREFYKDNSLDIFSTCQLCPGSNITGTVGATSVAECSLPSCYPGTYLDVSSNACEPCPVGEFQSEKWQISCMACPAKYSTVGEGASNSSQCKYVCPDGAEEGSSNGTCVDCLQGFYKDNTIDRFSCLGCPQDRITTGNGSTSVAQCSLLSCSAGRYYNSSSDSCQDCPVGSYQSERNQITCIVCTTNYTTLSNGSSQAADCQFYCPSGYEHNATIGAQSCEVCPRETYKSNNNSLFDSCQPCTAGFIATQEGATDKQQCTVRDCGPGTYLNTSENVCVNCSIGSYQSTKWQTQCSSCPVNYTTSFEGSTRQADCTFFCPSGYESNVTTRTCMMCERGTYKDNIEDVFGVCQACPEGYITPNNGATSSADCSILSCEAGTYRNVSNNTCVFCPVGTYQPDQWQTSCTACPVNYTTTHEGNVNQTACAFYCPPGYEVGSGFEQCDICPQGSFSNRTVDVFGVCEMCPPATTTTNIGAASLAECNIAACDPGSYLNISSNMCMGCPVGSYQPSKWQTQCIQCSTNFTTSSMGSNSSSDCLFYCPAGFEKEVGNNSCVICSVGEYRSSNDVFGDCQMCPLGFITPLPGAVSQTNCNIVACKAGTYRNTTTNICEDCPVGTYQSSKWQDGCTTCPSSYTTNSTGKTQQADCSFYCPSGYESQGLLCQGCPRGSYKDNADNIFGVCQTCPSDTTTENVNTTSKAGCNQAACGAGQYRDTVNNTCKSCAIGFYQPTIWQDACLQCGASETTAQEASTDQSQCLFYCSSGYEVTGTRQCSGCLRGEYKDNTVDTFGSCTPCPAGNTTRGINSTSLADCNIDACVPGESLDSSSSMCKPCPVGQYQANSLADTCNQCPLYQTTAGSGSTSLADCYLHCPIGMENSTGTCQDCAVGFYKTTEGAYPCTQCPTEKITPSTGATNQSQCNIDDCNAGKQYSPELQTCVACPVGSYRDKSEGLQCTVCPIAFYTAGNGSTSVADCNIANCQAGTYRHEPSNTCLNCPWDTYQDEARQSVCKPCGPGLKVWAVSSTNSSDCISSDECTNGEATCHPDATCTDVSGSPGFTCACNTGFLGDGITCTHQCVNSPCQNKAICERTTLGKGYNCICSDRYSGDVCEIRLPEDPSARLGTDLIIGAAVGVPILIILAVLIIVACTAKFYRKRRSNPPSYSDMSYKNTLYNSKASYDSKVMSLPGVGVASLPLFQAQKPVRPPYFDDTEDGPDSPNNSPSSRIDAKSVSTYQTFDPKFGNFIR